jgi:predicted negative regulator of RcsB-dependent stress response
MLLLIVVFAVGVYVGYKYPQQVDQAVQAVKTAFNDLKDKFSKKSS